VVNRGLPVGRSFGLPPLRHRQSPGDGRTLAHFCGKHQILWSSRRIPSAYFYRATSSVDEGYRHHILWSRRFGLGRSPVPASGELRGEDVDNYAGCRAFVPRPDKKADMADRQRERMSGTSRRGGPWPGLVGKRMAGRSSALLTICSQTVHIHLDVAAHVRGKHAGQAHNGGRVCTSWDRLAGFKSRHPDDQ
jgi:hypothetical protein